MEFRKRVATAVGGNVAGDGDIVCQQETRADPRAILEQSTPSRAASKRVVNSALKEIVILALNHGDLGLAVNFVETEVGLVGDVSSPDEISEFYRVRVDVKLRCEPVRVAHSQARAHENLLFSGEYAVAGEVYDERDDRGRDLDADAVARNALRRLGRALAELDLVGAAQGAVGAGPVARGYALYLFVLVCLAPLAVVANSLVVGRESAWQTHGDE